MDLLKGKAPPRLHSAILRTWYMGWCTAARFQQRGFCMWGCEHKDDVREYACCSVLWDFAWKRLRLSRPSTPAEQREAFLGLHQTWSKRDFPLLRRHAVLMYVSYKAHAAWRHMGAPRPAPPGLLRQALAEACRGDPGTIRLIDHIWG